MSYRELRQRIRQAERQKLSTLKWDIAVQNKFSIPFSCLVFALLAPALGIRSHRGSGSIGMGIAILIGFAYYVVWNYLANLADQGGICPLLGRLASQLSHRRRRPHPHLPRPAVNRLPPSSHQPLAHGPPPQPLLPIATYGLLTVATIPISPAVQPRSCYWRHASFRYPRGKQV